MDFSAHVRSLDTQWRQSGFPLFPSVPLTDAEFLVDVSLSRCHVGQTINLDTVNELRWNVDARTHPIRVIVERLLGEESDWFGKGVSLSIYNFPFSLLVHERLNLSLS